MRIILILVLLIFGGCNNTGEALNQKPEPVCGESLNESNSLFCGRPLADWLISSSLINFPNKISLKVNNYEAFNECSGGSFPLAITRSLPIVIQGQNFMHPAGGNIKISITDLGADCLGNTPFYSNESQIYNLTEAAGREIVEISLE